LDRSAVKPARLPIPRRPGGAREACPTLPAASGRRRLTTRVCATTAVVRSQRTVTVGVEMLVHAHA
jgi:hypothetical protein